VIYPQPATVALKRSDGATAVKIEVILASRQPWWSEYKGKALKDLIEIKTFDATLVNPLSCRFPT